MLVSLLVLALGHAACTPSPRIKDILDRSGEFEGKAVKVSGTVVEAANILVLAAGDQAGASGAAPPKRAFGAAATGHYVTSST